MKPADKLLVQGSLAGVVAATAMAAWFLVIDLLGGRPFYTPAFIASVLAGTDAVSIDAQIVIAYTVIHYVAFALVGIAVVWALRTMHTTPGLLIGCVLGFLLFNLMFYGSVVITGQQVVHELGWPPVLIGNVIAGVVLMGYLHFTGVIRAMSWAEVLSRHQIIREGLIAGLLGATTVAIWFLAFDSIAAEIFLTPAALGSAIFQGARSMSEVEISVANVAAYTVLHLFGFLVIGFVAAAVLTEAEHTPPLLLGAVLLFVTFGALFIGLLAVMAEWILEALALWTIMIGNLLAAVVMGVYLWRSHPNLRQQLTSAREHPAELEEPV